MYHYKVYIFIYIYPSLYFIPFRTIIINSSRNLLFQKKTQANIVAYRKIITKRLYCSPLLTFCKQLSDMIIGQRNVFKLSPSCCSLVYMFVQLVLSSRENCHQSNFNIHCTSQCQKISYLVGHSACFYEFKALFFRQMARQPITSTISCMYMLVGR